MSAFNLRDNRQPKFENTLQSPQPPIFFHHVVDGEATSLQVQVLGADLSHTFTHSRAKQHFKSYITRDLLDRKTTGFLTLTASNSNNGTPRRIVLAWAESGHGSGTKGDVLDASPGTLRNAFWARRVAIVGKLLGVNMKSPFDGRAGRGTPGLFRSSHVELKLAVHGIFTLLRAFRIARDMNAVTTRQLQRLRAARWSDGSCPALEVFFSRKNCGVCKHFIDKLQEMTGVAIKLTWHDRLQKVEYKVQNISRCAPIPAAGQDAVAVDDQEMDFGDHVDTALDDMSACFGEPSANGAAQGGEHVDLASNNGLPPQSDASNPVDTYVEGLAYRVGQIEERPQGAQAAIVQLAESIRRRQSHAQANIAKPLPPTAEMEPPGATTARKVEDMALAGMQKKRVGGVYAMRREPRLRNRLRHTSPSPDFAMPGQTAEAPSGRPLW